MIKALLFDFSRTLLFPKDKSYSGGLNSLHKTLSENPNYKFLDNFELNTEVMKYLETIKGNFFIYIFTSESIQETPDIKEDISKIFKKIFSAQKMNLDKKDPESYKIISKEINLIPQEILFVDDNSENISAARKAGFQTIQYIDNKSLLEKISNLK